MTNAIVTLPVLASTAKVSAKPAKRVISAKPVTAKVEAKPAKVVAKPVTPVAAPAKPSANVTRTAATIAAGACNFGGLSDRDAAYVTFYASLAKAAANGVVTLRAIVDSGRKPNYQGSAKPHDAGVIQRLAKASLVATRDNGAAFVFTKAALTHAAYVRGAGK